MKKNVYLIQVNSVFGETEKSSYIPYAIGCLASYAVKSPIVRENYEFKDFIYLRESVDAALEKIEAPYLVGFSSYIWNMEYNLLLASKIRQMYPECIIVFGGHNVSPDARDLKTYPDIDILIHGEGERPFRAMLVALSAGRSLGSVSNISYKKKDGSFATTKTVLNKTVADFPSPYLDGWFDKIIQNSDIKFSLIWETNRGCPNRCAFCDWGLLKAKIKKYSMKRIRAEIEWMVKNKIEYIYCSDANFGIFDRDEEITDLIIESKRKYGYPQKFKTNFTKNRDEFVLKLGKKMYAAEIGKSPTLSFQSMSPVVLKNIGRTNMDLEHFSRLMSLYNSSGIPAYSELILGLPGETYASFADGVSKLLECGQHKSIGIYPCELLPNSLLGSPEFVKKHGIVTKRMKFSLYHCEPDSTEVPEYSTTILATDTLNSADWERAYCFSMLIQSLHDLGLLRSVSIFMHYEKGVKYREFYEGLFAYYSDKDDSICGEVFKELKKFTHGITLGKNAFTAVFEGFGAITWGFEEYMFLRFAKDIDKFFDEVHAYAERFGVDEALLRELIDYQKSIVKKPGFTEGELRFFHDFYSYFEAAFNNTPSKLEKKENLLKIRDVFPVKSWEDYAKVAIWYGRRDDRAIYTSAKEGVEHIVL